MAAIATGVYLAWAIPAEQQLRRRPSRRHREGAHRRTRYPAAQTALTIFACFAAILLHPAHRAAERRGGAAARRWCAATGAWSAWSASCSPAWSSCSPSRSVRTLFELTRAAGVAVLRAARARRGVEPALPAGVAQPHPRPLAGHRRRPGQPVREGARRTGGQARAVSGAGRRRLRPGRPTGRCRPAGTRRRRAAARGRCGGRAARSPRARRRSAPASSGPASSVSSGCACSAVTFASMMPSRRATRCTCVSTGITGRPSEKSSTQAAVLGPTPGSARQVRLRLVVGHPVEHRRGPGAPRARAERLEDALDARRLGVREAAEGDGLLDLRRRRRRAPRSSPGTAP